MNPIVRRIGRTVRRILHTVWPDLVLDERLLGELVWNKLQEEPQLRPWIEQMSDEQARLHFGEEEALEGEQLRRVTRYFHAWRIWMLRQRIGARLPEAKILDVGDSDGLLLKHLGKTGTGFNLSEAVIRNITANGIEARLGDGQALPFEDRVFDGVLCFETLEHVESPHQLLMELARVCKPEGRIYLSIPWVPRTFIHSRNPEYPRGVMHVFEFCRKDFDALLSHTPLRMTWADICWVIGKPRTPAQWAFLQCYRRSHMVAGCFRGFQVFELAPVAQEDAHVVEQRAVLGRAF